VIPCLAPLPGDGGGVVTEVFCGGLRFIDVELPHQIQGLPHGGLCFLGVSPSVLGELEQFVDLEKGAVAIGVHSLFVLLGGKVDLGSRKGCGDYTQFSRSFFGVGLLVLDGSIKAHEGASGAVIDRD
jgi:hypothetical protein